MVAGATLITMNPERHVITDGALAILGDRIVAVGKREALTREVAAREVIDARRFVVTPGFVDAHIHITGDPLTRGLVRGAPGDSFDDRLTRWVIPLFRGQTPNDERLSAQCAALAMMRHGTTCFMEAGTVVHLNEVMEGLAGTGIRGRVGEWVEGRAYDPAADEARLSAKAIAALEAEIARYPDRDDARLAAWPILVGHSTNSDDVWRAAAALAKDRGLRVSAHMSPHPSDAEWYLEHHGRRPLEYLADLDVLGEHLALTHLAHLDHRELSMLTQSGTHAICCPQAALLGAFGITQTGLFPEMAAAGCNIMLGTDGAATDILSSARLLAGLYRDARGDEDLFPASAILELATLNGARGMGMSHAIGSLEVGKKADFVLHDTSAPDWGGALFDPIVQLALAAPPGGVHSVWIDGVRVIDGGRPTLIDEDKLLADARRAGAALVERLGLPIQTTWPML